MKSHILHERPEFDTVRDLIEWAGKEYNDRIAYSYRVTPRTEEITKVSFPELRRDVRSLASALLQRGCAGKHCALIGKYSYEWAVMYFATLSIGAVLIPLDRDWHAEDLADTVKKAGAEYLFCDEDLADKEAVIRHTAGLHNPTYFLGARRGLHSLRALIAEGEAVFYANPERYFSAPVDPNAMALLVFTSGTTGKGKGVMLNQTAILRDIAAAVPYIDYGKKTLGVLPPHHTYGSTVMVLAHAAIGAEVYVSAGIRYITKELKEQKPEHLVLVPLYLETFYRRILASVKEQKKDAILFGMIKTSNALRKLGIDRRRQMFRSVRAAFGGEVRTIISGGAPINPKILAFFDAIGISTLNGYGITECAPLIAFNRSRNIVPDSVGNVIDIDEVKIDQPNEDGEGEILVKGPNVMLGYYKDPEATAEAIDAEGFFHTGDYGRLDESGILFITGRKKNLIILSNGKNVYPEEIENSLIAVPGVLDIVVYEGQSRRGLEYNAIVAEVYPDVEFMEKNGIESFEEYFKKFVEDYNKNAVPYKKIATVKVRTTEFPKNTLRKIMRFQLDTTID